MSFKITIQNKIINFPDSAESPNWAPAMVAFAKAVEDALALFSSPYDVAPQSQVIDAYNPGTDISITNLLFPPTKVYFVEVAYSVYRTTSVTTVVEGGKLILQYDASRPSTKKWDVAQHRQGDAGMTFTCSDLGQLKFTSSTLAGINHEGFISFRGLSVLKA